MRWVRCNSMHLAAVDVQAAQASQDIRDQIDIDGEMLSEYGRAFLNDNDEAVACIGLWPVAPGVGQAWMFVSDEALLHGKAFARGVCQILEGEVKERGYSKVKATCESRHAAAVRFLEWLGFSFVADLPAYGQPPECADHKLYERSEDVRH